MTITTVEGFWEALEKSGLLQESQLAEARQIASEAGDVKTLARTLVKKEFLSRWQAAQLLAGRTTVFFLGKYKLIDMLGRGGMGGVFLAQHTMMNRRVALKVISKQIAQDPAALEQFLAEARAIAAVDHPNIVRAYNVDCEDGRYYLVMEYVEGKDLQRLVDEEGPLDFQKVADYIRQAAEGLAHAHGRNLIHCDIKPANLLVTEEGVVKILDLGLARLTAKEKQSEEKEKEVDPRVLGTVDYQAPELAMGNAQVDARADIYSLGCTMFFLLTGRPPFGEGSLHERIVKHQTQPPPDIAALRPGTPKDLIAICRKMMAKKPANRFQSAEEVSKLLARWRPPQPKLRKAVPLEETEASPSEATEKEPSPVEAGGIEEKAGARGAVSSPARSGRGTSLLAPLPPWAWIAGGAALVVLVGLVIVWLVIQSSPPAPSGHAKKTPRASGPIVEEESSFVPPPPKAPIPPEEKKPPESSSEPGTKEKPSESPPSEKPPEPKPEEKPTPKPEEKPSAKPEEKPQPKPEQKPPAKPEEKPAKPEEKPQPKPKQKPPAPPDPLAKLPKRVGLPAVAEKEAPSPQPTLISELQFGPDDIWDLSFIGGNAVFKGGQPAFRLEQKKRTETGFQWQVLLDTGAQSGGAPRSSPVALFEYKNDGRQLFFRWLPEANPAQAGLLRNCMLGVYFGGQPHVVALREPLLAPPVAFHPIKLAKPTMVEIPDLPTNTERIFVEFTGIEGLKEVEGLKKPDFEFQPKGPIPIGKPCELVFQWTDRANNKVPGIIVQITPRSEGKRIRIQAQLKSPPVKDLRTKYPLEDAVRAQNQADEIRKKLDEDSRQQDHKKRMPQEERNKHLQLMNKLIGQAWLIRMQHVLEDGIQIHYKVHFEISEKYKVELAHSQDAPVQKTEPQPKEKK